MRQIFSDIIWIKFKCEPNANSDMPVPALTQVYIGQGGDTVPEVSIREG